MARVPKNAGAQTFLETGGARFCLTFTIPPRAGCWRACAGAFFFLLCFLSETPWRDEGATIVPSEARRQLESATRQKEVVDRGRKCINMVSFGTAATGRSRRGTSSRVHLCPLQLVLCGSGRVRERDRPRVPQAGGLARVRKAAGQRGGEVAPPCAVPDPSSRQQQHKPHRLALGGGTARHHLRCRVSRRRQACSGDFGWLRVRDPGQLGWLASPSALSIGAGAGGCSKPSSVQ